MRFFSNKKNKGSALVEFALLATVMIPILLYTQYFSEAIHLQMKADEINYFVGWQLAAFKITDYGQSQKNTEVSARLETAINTVRAYTVDKYSDFDSADQLPNSKFIMINPDPITNASITTEQLQISWLPQHADDTGESSILTKIIGFINKGVNVVLGLYSFNYEHAGIKSHVNVRYRVTERLSNNQKFMNRSDAGGNGGFFNGDMINQEMVNGINQGNGYTSPDFVVWFDTWSLADGSNVEQGMYNHPFTKQVNRMMIFGLFNSEKNTSDLPDGLTDFLNKIGKIKDKFNKFAEKFGLADIDPTRAHVSAYNYYHENTQGDRRKGDYHKNEDDPEHQNKYNTIPLWYHSNYGATGYSKSLGIRRDHYMGNGTAQCNYTRNCEP